MTAELTFRGVKGRTLDDQVRAVSSGYASVAEMAVDELGAMVVELGQRVAALEAGQGVARSWGEPGPGRGAD